LSNIMVHRMLFGTHRSQRLAEVPTNYLKWFLTTCKLSTGLWAAIRMELLARSEAKGRGW
jgi:uncharacterized protein (DUF3820 family)